MLTLYFGDQVIRSTLDHPFQEKDRGWILAGELKIGDQIQTITGDFAAITDIVNKGEVERVYNLRVNEYHTYYVVTPNRQIALLVHNAEYLPGGEPATTITPAVVLKREIDGVMYVFFKKTADGDWYGLPLKRVLIRDEFGVPIIRDGQPQTSIDLTGAQKVNSEILILTLNHPADPGWAAIAKQYGNLLPINPQGFQKNLANGDGSLWAFVKYEAKTAAAVAAGAALGMAINKAIKSGLATAARLTADEIATGQRLEAQLERSLKESPHIGAEYVDDLGRTYDAMGKPAASRFWNKAEFLKSINEHLLKSNDFTVIDLTGFTQEQIDAVRAHLCNVNSRATISHNKDWFLIMAGVIRVSDKQSWSSANWAYSALMDYLIEAVTGVQEIAHRVEVSKWMQHLSFPMLYEENPEVARIVFTTLQNVAERCAAGDLLCKVEGRVLDDVSQAQFREAMGRLVSVLKNEHVHE